MKVCIVGKYLNVITKVG